MAAIGTEQRWQKGVDMKSLWWSALAAAAAAAAWASAEAQTDAKPAPAAASAPLAAKAGPKRLTPTELRDSATMPGDLRPEDRVTNQIVIPLRKGAGPRKAPVSSARRPAAAASGGIDDSAARCEAEASGQASETCRAARAGPARTR
jgi:hypothetical protein